MKKTKLIALMIGLVVTGLSFGSAHAEFVLGLQGGFSSSKGDVAYRGTGSTPVDELRLGKENNNAIGVFGQYRHSLSNNVFLGVHIGYTADSATLKGSDDYTYRTADYSTATPLLKRTFPGLLTINTKPIMFMISWD